MNNNSLPAIFWNESKKWKLQARSNVEQIKI
jgi:hypothetical protein